MESKKEAASLNSSKYLRRISNHHKIAELSLIIKDFFKESLHLQYEYTYEELEELVGRKRISPEIKEKIFSLCKHFESLEYRSRRPTGKGIQSLKKAMREIIKEIMPKTKAEKPSFNLLEKIRKNKRKHAIISKMIKKTKEEKTRNLIKKAQEEIVNKEMKDDNEARQIAKFVSASLSLGVKIQDIRKELREMGFHKQKVDIVIKQR